MFNYSIFTPRFQQKLSFFFFMVYITQSYVNLSFYSCGQYTERIPRRPLHTTGGFDSKQQDTEKHPLTSSSLSLFQIITSTNFHFQAPQKAPETEILIKIEYPNVRKYPICLRMLSLYFLLSFSAATASSGFSTTATADFCIGIRQFLLFPNSIITVSSVMSITMP